MQDGERKSFLGQVGLTLLGLTLVSAEEFGKAVGKLVEEGKLAASDAERLVKDAMGGGTSKLEQIGSMLSEAVRRQVERACSGAPGPFGEASPFGAAGPCGKAPGAGETGPREAAGAKGAEAPNAEELRLRLAAVEARLAALEARLAADQSSGQTSSQADADAQRKEDY